MVKLIHPFAGATALLIIGTFWLSTVLSELTGSTAAVVAVKTAIPWGFVLLVPALAVAGGSGFRLAGGQAKGLSATKLRRMRAIATNGILILAPSALFLSWKAAALDFDTAFYAIQTLELAAGAVNLVLLSLNIRDGFRMTGRLRRLPANRPE